MAYSQFVDAESKLRLARLALADVDRLALLGLVLVVGDLQTGRLRGFPEPLHSLPRVRAHPPAVPAGQGIQQHAGGVTLLGSVPQVPGRLLQGTALVQGNRLAHVFLC